MTETLGLARYRVTVEALDDLALPAYLGSTLRGAFGPAVYEGDLTPFRPYLVLGQWTHVGSGTTFGLGGYRIEEGR
jgi:CRISPR-associated endoribonuclease Cas6